MAAPAATSTGTHLSVAWCKDGPKAKDVRSKTGPAHLDWVVKKRQVELAGPILSEHGDVEGSLVVANAENLEGLLKEDPYAKAGAFKEREIRTWIKSVVKNDEGQNERLGRGKWFVVWCMDKAEMHERRRKTKAERLKWWKECGRRGWIGPFVEGDQSVGSMVFCEGENLNDVIEWAKTDPYKRADVLERVTVREVRKIVENFHLAAN